MVQMMKKLITKIINLLMHFANKGDVSDGSHTFSEVYEHRETLFVELMKAYPELSWWSWRHSDGEKAFGYPYFIAGINKKADHQITYHSINEDIRIAAKLIYDKKTRRAVQGFADIIAEFIKNKYKDIKIEKEASIAQECYLQCLVIEQGEGECAEAIATKFPELVSRYNSEEVNNE